MSAKFSILIITYNSNKDLTRLFDCLDAQTIRDFETILIDNASPDSPPQELIIKRSDTFIQNTENVGFARANNQGAKVANGEWLILLNPDAFPKENWLEEIEKGIAAFKDCQCFGSLQYFDGQEGILDGAGDCFSIYGIAWRGGHRKPLPQKIENCEIFSACAAAAIWQKSRFLELGGFEESFVSYYEDVDLGFRHRLRRGKCIMLANAIVYHRGSGSSSRYSDYAVFHGTRNRELAYIRLMPSPWFALMLLPHLFWVVLLWIHAIFRGAFRAYSAGIFASIKLIPQALSHRKKIQSEKTAKNSELFELIEFSPLKLLRRDCVIKQIKNSDR